MSYPPNPPRTNSDRAYEGLQLCDKMQELTGVDTTQDQVSDIICTLMHLCRLSKHVSNVDLSFEAALSQARTNFEAEIVEDPDGV